MYRLLRILFPSKGRHMESQAQENVHLSGQTGVGPILNAMEIDIIEIALLEYGKRLKVIPENFRECDAIANAYKKIGMARKAGCCDAVRLFGM